MVSVLQNVAIDCADAYELARFWSSVTGSPLHPEASPGDRETQVPLAEGPVLYFNQVPEAKTVKNRIHLCLRPASTRDQEVDRLLGLGAAFVADHRNPDGSGWAILADPEGNEFCVLRSESDRAATDSAELPAVSEPVEASREEEVETVCRVCGYDGEVFWEGGWPTAAICPCCGNESDVGDAGVMGLRNYRGYWVGRGAPWDSPREERKRRLQGWNLQQQLANIPPEWR